MVEMVIGILLGGCIVYGVFMYCKLNDRIWTMEKKLTYIEDRLYDIRNKNRPSDDNNS